MGLDLTNFAYKVGWLSTEHVLLLRHLQRSEEREVMQSIRNRSREKVTVIDGYVYNWKVECICSSYKSYCLLLRIVIDH
jgi:hypothetical protein